MSIISKVKSARKTFVSEGLTGVARDLRAHVYERTDFVAAQRDLRVPVVGARCSVDFELKRIPDETLMGFKEMPEPLSRHYDYRFQHQMRQCYGAFVDGRIVALMWPFFEADNARMVTRWRYLLPDEARISNIWAAPEVRGTGLIDECLGRFMGVLGEAGFRYLYAFTWVGNHSSRRLHERLGFREVAKITQYSMSWQGEGRGLYLREPIPRDPLATDHPGGDCDLPETIG